MKYLILIFFVFSNLFALNISNDDIHYENFPLEVFTDTRNQHTIQTVLNAPFEKAYSKESFGYKRNQTFWIRTHLRNTSSKDQTVYLYHKDAYTYLEVTFYQLSGDKLLETSELGRNIPLSAKAIKDSSPVYLVLLKPGEERTVYIRNVSTSTMLVNLQVLNSANYHKANMSKNGYFFFFFGIVISLAFYNLMLFLSIRSVEYLYYVFFMVGSIAYLLYVSGIPLEFLGVKGEDFSLFLYGVILLQVSLVWFTQRVLETKKNLPSIHKFLNILIVINGLFLVVALIFSINSILTLLSSFALIYAFSLLVIGYVAYRKTIKTSIYFLYSIGLYLLFAMIGIFTYLGIFPYTNFTRYALFLGSLSEVFLLSLLLSYRISLLRNRAIQSEKELKEEVIHRNAILKSQVDERTQALQSLNAGLEVRVKNAIEEIRKKDEDLMRQSRMAMMGEMLSMIAHQWRQPLSSIASVRNNMQIELELNSMDKENFLEQLNDIDTYIQFMSKTIEDFRNFFAPERGKSMVNLADVIVDAVGIIAPVLKQNLIDISIMMSSTQKIYTYRNELIQVILNIIKNSQDAFLDKNGDEPKISIELSENKNLQILKIFDNAGGISEDVIERIFDPYFSTKEDKNGTGLGLYMSKIIIQEHCLGTIEAVNIGDGACFTITFDLDKIEHE